MLLCVWLSSQVGHTDVHIGLFDWCMLLHIIAFCYLSLSFTELLFNIQSICKLSFHVTCSILWIHNKTVYSVHTHHINKEMQFGVKKNCIYLQHSSAENIWRKDVSEFLIPHSPILRSIIPVEFIKNKVTIMHRHNSHNTTIFAIFT